MKPWRPDKHKPSMNYVAQQGLTLIELMIGLTIVAVFVGIGIPNFRQLIGSQKRVTITNELVATFMLARNEAMKSARHVSVCVSVDGENCASKEPDWRNGWIVFANTRRANATVRDDDEPLIRVFPSLPANINMIQSTSLSASPAVVFSPLGDVNVSGFVTYCDFSGDVNARAIVLERSGAARVLATQSDGGAIDCG